MLCLRLCAGLPLLAFVVWRCRCPNTADTKPQASPRKCPAAQFRCLCSRGISRLRVLALLGLRALSSLCCLPWRRHLVRPYCTRDSFNLEHEMGVNSTRNQRPVASYCSTSARWLGSVYKEAIRARDSPRGGTEERRAPFGARRARARAAGVPRTHICLAPPLPLFNQVLMVTFASFSRAVVHWSATAAVT